MRKNKKSLVWILIFTIIFNFIPALNTKAVDDINIISNTSITAEIAKKWAAQKGASATFINLADKYWTYASSRGGVNPAVAYVQSALETGFGNFGGVIDASFNNPCGLKITAGGDDADPNAHQKFANWDQGVQAHLDHLALYAGAVGYPRVDTYDPRHFVTKGSAPTVLALTNKWTGNNYGTKVMNLYNSLSTMQANNTTHGIIDTPTNGFNVTGSSLDIKGWTINPSGVASVNVYVDGKKMVSTTCNISRPDVQAAYPGYKNADTSGYNATINLSGISNGTKTIRVEAVGNDGTIRNDEVKVSINKPAPIESIDYPSDNSTVKGDSLKVSGWALNSSGVKDIEIFIDDVSKGKATIGQSRTDVGAAYPVYPNASTSGYSADINISNVLGGERILKVVQKGNDGSIHSSTKKIKIDKLIPIGTIDYPYNGAKVSGNKLTVSGWALNDKGISKIEIYVDNVLAGNATIGLSRPDVAAVYKNYSNAAISGYSGIVDLTKIAGGSRKVAVKQIGNDGTTITSQNTIFVDKPTPNQCIDYPSNNLIVRGNTLNVSGWSLNNSGVDKIEIYIDGVLKGDTTATLPRPDVAAAYKSYSNAGTSGFSKAIDISDVQGGRRNLKLVQKGKDGSSYISQTIINVDRPQPNQCIDYPYSGLGVSGDTLNVSGWSLNYFGVDKIEVYVDNKLKQTITTGGARLDVKAAYPSYPEAATSGFNTTVNVADISGGNREVKVVQTGKDGSKVSSVAMINIKKLVPILAVDSPGSATVTGNSLTVSGWALNPKDVDKINVYIDNKLITSTTTGISRADVGNLYPAYGKARTSGYNTQVDIKNIADGNRLVKVEQVGKDGTTCSIEKTIKIDRPDPIQSIDNPYTNKVISTNTLEVSGWSLNSRDIDKINVYIDGKFMDIATIGIARLDVKAAYPQYQNAGTSGYSALIDLREIKGGIRTVKVEQVGKDGSKFGSEVKVNVAKPVPVGCIDYPSSGTVIKNKVVKVSGWALNPSGISKIEVFVDGKYKTNATIGLSRPDVAAAYKTYTNATNSGYEATNIGLNDIAPGKRTIEIRQTGNDGSVYSSYTDINIQKKAAITNLDLPKAGYLEPNSTLNVAGWALNDSGVKNIYTYIDGSRVLISTLNQNRADVNNAYSGYPDGDKCGFNTNINISSLSVGKHVIKVEAIGYDGTISSSESTFYYKEKKVLVVVDPGHNYGNDGGAEDTHNGVYYSETELNMSVSIKLKSALESQGYTVVLTRNPFERPTDSLETSLRNRAILANTLNADLFISIHHNKGGSAARGSEVYYTQKSVPDAGMPTQNPDKLARSSDLAGIAASSISANTGLYNRGAKGDISTLTYSLSVLRNTKMPAILVECGFISNAEEAKLLANPAIQQATANGLTQAVKQRF